ncbi:MAG: substrate-binding domain-containing protein [Pirellulales bacterium]|nr:substrate-binding domain-containing protein [Pirellulales bacterium]
MHYAARCLLAVLLAGFSILLGGCADQAPPADPANTTAPPAAAVTDASDEILILCGSSFRPPMERLVAMYQDQTGKRVALSFGGSEDHLPNVKAKKAGDVYVTHTPYIQYTRDAGALLREVEVGFLAPVLVVTKGNPKQIQTIEDLARPGLEVVLPNPEYSTCGEMVDKLLEKKQIKDAVRKNVGSALMKHHSEIGNHLKLGTREAGIMWNGVAHNYLDAIDVVPAPYEYDEEIRVAVMGLSYSKNIKAVEPFLDFVEAHGKDVFAEFGYLK